jgi:hypothetical protein
LILGFCSYCAPVNSFVAQPQLIFITNGFSAPCDPPVFSFVQEGDACDPSSLTVAADRCDVVHPDGLNGNPLALKVAVTSANCDGPTSKVHFSIVGPSSGGNTVRSTCSQPNINTGDTTWSCTCTGSTCSLYDDITRVSLLTKGETVVTANVVDASHSASIETVDTFQVGYSEYRLLVL